ncbi:hypothetical protein [Roseivirga misakiensis]|uniref:Uncharacterized protein n=1 Tax=Roseivirga misakiensis TaxID=1563681 RepID=A0A1E5SL95_9BACT|nr:hypothetical protein [Roseivirga misakiensis]OEJ99816.1 hypothetical protein BFP71_09690 [Roseivirga misakiensis]
MSKTKSNLGLRFFILEIFSIFLGVTIAFLANHWNDLRKDRISEQKILVEIKKELEADLSDIKTNIGGHERGLAAVALFQKYCTGQEVSFDSLSANYSRLYRDYISITNTTAYESLKSKGLDIISNEKLRNDIVLLYDFEYEVLEKLEEQYQPAQFHQNYFTTLTEHFKDYITFDQNGQLFFNKKYQKEIDTEIMMILKEIKDWRGFLTRAYMQTVDRVVSVSQAIDKEIEE